MHRTSPTLVVFAVVLIAAPASAQTMPTAQQEMQSAQFLVGKWSCTHTVGDFSGTYTTTYASVLGSAWLEQTYDFPVTREDAAVHADYFLGYDVRLRGPQQRPVLRHARHACGQRLVVELRPPRTVRQGGVDQEVGRRVHGGWAELPGKWEAGYRAPQLSEGGLRSSALSLPPEALEAVRQLRTAVTLVREPRDEQRERLGVPGDP